MPTVAAAEAPTFELDNAVITGLASPSRGARDTAVWRIRFEADKPSPAHAVTREEVFVVLEGALTARYAEREETAVAGDALIVRSGEQFSLVSVGGPSQAVCVLPDRDNLRTGMEKVRERVAELGGSSVFLTLTDVDDDARDQFVEGFRSQSAKEYAEIVEECETKFVKEIEFERFRENYTFEEAEEIRQDLEKLRRQSVHQYVTHGAPLGIDGVTTELHSDTSPRSNP